jgi:hypothetical protein
MRPALLNSPCALDSIAERMMHQKAGNRGTAR